MAVKNKDIVYVLRMRNETRAALRAYRGDLQSAAEAAAAATREAKTMATQARALDTAIRRTGASTASIASNMAAATSAVRTANRELSRFSSAANGTAKVGQNMANVTQNISGTTNALRGLNTALARFASAAQRTGNLAQQLNSGATAVNAATTALRNATTQATAFARASQQAGQSLQNMGGGRGGGRGGSGIFDGLLSSATAARAAIAGVVAAAAGLAGNALFGITDEFTAMQSQLKLVTGSTAELTQTYADLFAMAQNTRQSLNGTVELYSRISRATQTLDISQKQVLELTDAINKSVAIFGGPAASAEAALFQLSQAFASGTLRGEELNSVLEQSPRLAQAIADGMGVAVGSLRTMAEQNKLTSANIIKAIMSQRDVLDKEFAKIGVTVGQAMVVARNSVIDYVGSVDKATKTSSNFAQAIIGATQSLRDPNLVKAGVSAMTLFGQAINGAVKAAVLLSQHLDLLGAAFGALAAYSSRGILVPIVTTMVNAARGAAALAFGLTSISTAAAVVNARLRVMMTLLARSGIGLAVLAIGAGIGYWVSRTSDAEKATDDLAATVAKVKGAYDEAGGSVEEMAKKIDGLTKTQIRSQLELARVRLQNAKSGLQDSGIFGNISQAQITGLTNGPNGQAFDKQFTALKNLTARFQDGTLPVENFRKKLDEIGSNPANKMIEFLAKNLLDLSEAVKEPEEQVKTLEALLAAMSGTATEAQKSLLGVGAGAEEAGKRVTKAAILLSNATTSMRALQALSPTGKQQQERGDGIAVAQAAYAKAKADLDRVFASGNLSQSDYTSQLAQQKKYLQDAIDDTRGLIDARKALKAYEQEAANANIYDARLRAVQQINQEYQEQLKLIKDGDKAEKDRALAARNSKLNALDGQAKYDIAKSLSDNLRDMESENRLIGLTTAAKSRLNAVMQVEKQLRESGLGIPDQKKFLQEYIGLYDQLATIQNRANFADNLGGQIKDLVQQASVIGVAADQQDKLNKLIEFENAARQSGLKDVDEWRNKYIQAIDAVKAAQEKANQNFALGFKEGMDEFVKEATNARAQAADIAKGIGTDISSSIKGALKGDGFNFADLLKNIGGRFIDAGVDQLVGNVMKSFSASFGTQSADPAVQAQQIAQKQNDAYMMIVSGVEGAGQNFTTQLSLTLQGIIDRLNALIGGNAAGVGTNSNIGPSSFAAGRQLDLASVPGYAASSASTVKALKADIVQEVLNAGSGGTGGSIKFGGNFNAQVDNRLMQIMQEAARNSNMAVTAISGYRGGDPRFHGKGLAADFQLSDPTTGKVFGNYQNGQDFRVYEQFAQQAKLAQMRMYPELNDQFRWGGYFSGGKGKYGALDSMHFDLGGRPGLGMGGGSFANGLNDNQRALFPNAQSVGMNVQQLQQQITQVGTAAQRAATATQQVSNSYQSVGTAGATAGTAATQASTAVQQLGSSASAAAPQMQTAAAGIQSAGVAAASAGTQAKTVGQTGVSNFGAGLSALMGPLNQVVPGLGSFAQGIISFLGSLGQGIGGAKGSGGLGDFFGLFFANGGVMTPNGKMPLKTYSKGGVANRPQLAVFGEGRQNEAYVPLPDGKSIPVSMSGGGGGNSFKMGDIKINIETQGSSGDKGKDDAHAKNTAGQVAAAVDQAMTQWVLNQMRPGGMFAGGTK